MPFELRKWFPVLLTLREANIKIKVHQIEKYVEGCRTCAADREYYQLKDITEFFNEPTDDERLAVKENVDDASDSVRRDAGWIRVKLYDHFQLYKSRKGL